MHDPRAVHRDDGVKAGVLPEDKYRHVQELQQQGRIVAMADGSMNEIHHDARPFWKSRSAIALPVFAAIALFLLFSEHRAHFLGVLPYFLLLSCPLMHLFMHHSHGHRHNGSVRNDQTDSGSNHEQHG
jgi:hypothetical protein